MAVWYTQDPGAGPFKAHDSATLPGAGTGGVSITPPAATLSGASSAPTVLASAHRLATPGAALILLLGATALVATPNHHTRVPASGALFIGAKVPLLAVGNGLDFTVPSALVSLSLATPVVVRSDDHHARPAAAPLGMTAATAQVDWTNHRAVTVTTGAATLLSSPPLVSVANHRAITALAGQLLAVGGGTTVLVSTGLHISINTASLWFSRSAPLVWPPQVPLADITLTSHPEPYAALVAPEAYAARVAPETHGALVTPEQHGAVVAPETHTVSLST